MTRCFRMKAIIANLPLTTYSHDNIAVKISTTMAVIKLLSGDTHCPSSVEATPGVILPGTHDRHTAIPSSSAYVDTGQSMQLPPCPLPAYRPSGQSSGSPAPDGVKVPGGFTWHLALPIVAKVPASHCVQLLLVEAIKAEAEPAGHDKHVSEPKAVW